VRWRERGPGWRALLGVVIAGIVVLAVHLVLQASGASPSVSSDVSVLTAIALIPAFGLWLIVAVLPAWTRAIQERGDALDRRTPGHDTWLLLTVRRGVRLGWYRPARVAFDATGLTLTQTSGAPAAHRWSEFTDVAVQKRRVGNVWRATIVLRGPGLTIVAIPWVLGGWPSPDEVARQAGVLKAHVVSAHRSGG
jgi:hypothetical protein